MALGHISIAAETPRASLSVGGNRGSVAIFLTDTAAQLCAAFFNRRSQSRATAEKQLQTSH